MRVKGKITKYEKNQFCMPLGEAEIELTLQEFASQVSECDIETSKAFKMLQDLNKSAPQPQPAEDFDPTSMDARVWAKEFMRLYENNKLKPINAPDWLDEGLMIGWFANAIMAGYDTAQRRCEERAHPKPGEIEELIINNYSLDDIVNKLNELIKHLKELEKKVY